MGVAPLSKVTVIAPRGDYQEVLKRLSKFHDFQIIEDKSSQFDPTTQELAVRSVRLLAQVDQAVKDLAIPPNPGMIDVIFRGASIPQTDYQASSWGNLLDKVEKEAEPIRNEVRTELQRHAQLVKEEQDVQSTMGAIQAYSTISADLGRLRTLKRLHTVVTMVAAESLGELQKSLPDSIFVTQPVSESQTMVMLASAPTDAAKVEKVLKTLDLKPFALPESLPQSPAQAYAKLSEEMARASAAREETEKVIAALKEKYSEKLLVIRELAESSHRVLDETRMSGGLQRLATISGYIPNSREAEFIGEFQTWIVYAERVNPGEHGAPTLMRNPGPTAPFQQITKEQGIPGPHEVDPTPIVALVFPIFFGMMFGDLGHGLVMTAFFALVRARAKTNASLKLWANIFLACGITSMIFGVVFGEFFGFSLSSLIPIHPLVEIVSRPPNAAASLNSAGTFLIIEVAILIGIAHITTGLSLDIVGAIRGHEKMELLTAKIPTLVMYIGGILFGLSFISAGYSFNVISGSNPVPLIGLPTYQVGTVAIVLVFGSMLVLLLGKAVAIATGKLHEGSIVGAIGNGGMEVFELISRFLANTISYVRLAILLFVHASLLLAINLLLGFPIYIAVVPMVILNILVIMFEVLIVYIQDLRLHIYEFFTKFYAGTGTPFTRLFPEWVRARINWS
jgi:V/A-type H+/Na+-transporting ATPase subunit I